ncbi:L-ascorbate oxidase-like [Gigantopelta aegis]|uniref:L-ascorbate oxidase-like n=1 Tax=Gigantopelta aegis TaxID=1735272 RepID=UPI001B88E722|nr:L-ascorbate oxidase-like [Gigantopelta aegis]
MGEINGSSLCLLVFFFTASYLCQANRYPDYTKHPCARRCVVGERPRTCEYDFIQEYYFVLTKACYDCPFNATDCYRPHCVSGNGVRRAIMTVNRMLPGPAIHVCHNDTIVVNAKNRMEGEEGTAIHWHGIFHHDSQIMDGVSMLTQCPIPAYTSFQYRFKAENTGTHFWHSHAGSQRANGVFGSLVVHQPDSTNPHAALYQHDLPEHTIVVHDWLKTLAMNKFEGHYLAGYSDEPHSMLINGYFESVHLTRDTGDSSIRALMNQCQCVFCLQLGESTSLEEVKALDAAGGISRKLSGAVAKDTVTVPDGGYTVIRFVADNPGFGFLHCHVKFHLSLGMGLIIQVGKPHEMPKPPNNWPKCGDWKYPREDKNNEREGKGNGGEGKATGKDGGEKKSDVETEKQKKSPLTNEAHGVAITKALTSIVFLVTLMIL